MCHSEGDCGGGCHQPCRIMNKVLRLCIIKVIRAAGSSPVELQWNFSPCSHHAPFEKWTLLSFRCVTPRTSLASVNGFVAWLQTSWAEALCNLRYQCECSRLYLFVWHVSHLNMQEEEEEEWEETRPVFHKPELVGNGNQIYLGKWISRVPSGGGCGWGPITL